MPASGGASRIERKQPERPAARASERPEAALVGADGKWIGFFDGGLKLKKASVSGGPAVLVARLDSFERGGTWADNDTIIFATQATATGLQRVSANGGVPTVITWPDRARGELGHSCPDMRPGGQTVL